MKIIQKISGYFLLTLFAFTFLFSACKKDSAESVIEDRNFKMGFTSWPYDATLAAVNDTYDFIFANGDIYTEHIDDVIPWTQLFSGDFLPSELRSNIEGKAARKPADKELLLSVAFLNSSRDDIQLNYEGVKPEYGSLDDIQIEDAYVNYLVYLMNQFNADYLVVSIESNDLLINSPELWDEFRALMHNVRVRIKAYYPDVKVSESITLHNWYDSDLVEHDEYVAEIKDLVTDFDFAAISFYPFFKGLDDKKDFQKAFDFLHKQTSKPIAFVETCHLAKDLNVTGLGLSISGDVHEQSDYLETLLINAQENNYEFIIWWTHRDFDALWETFPDEIKDLGQIWRNTGLLNANGDERLAMELWRSIFEQ